jgi:hypothetical protein
LNPNSELEPFLIDIAKRFDKDGLEDVLGGVVRAVVFTPNLAGGMVRVSFLCMNLRRFCFLTAKLKLSDIMNS